jgi:hypothetical protein
LQKKTSAICHRKIFIFTKLHLEIDFYFCKENDFRLGNARLCTSLQVEVSKLAKQEKKKNFLQGKASWNLAALLNPAKFKSLIS